MRKLTRQKGRLILVIVGCVVALWIGASFLNRSPYRFMESAQLWFVQQNPSDSNESWAIYRTNEPFDELYAKASKELGEPSEPPRTSPATSPVKGATHFKVNGKDFYYVVEAARFKKGSSEILLNKSGGDYLLGENMMRQLPKWPGKESLIAIRRRSTVPDRVQGWIQGLQWGGITADSGGALFRSGGSGLRPEQMAEMEDRDRRFGRENPVDPNAPSNDLGFQAGELMKALEMGNFQSFTKAASLQIGEEFGMESGWYFNFFDTYLHPVFKLGLDSDGNTNFKTATRADGLGTATETFLVNGKTLKVTIAVRSDKGGPPVVDLEDLLIQAWRVRAAVVYIDKPFPANVLEVAERDMTKLATECNLTKFPGRDGKKSRTWPDVLKRLRTLKESDFE